MELASLLCFTAALPRGCATSLSRCNTGALAHCCAASSTHCRAGALRRCFTAACGTLERCEASFQASHAVVCFCCSAFNFSSAQSIRVGGKSVVGVGWRVRVGVGSWSRVERRGRSVRKQVGISTMVAGTGLDHGFGCLLLECSSSSAPAPNRSLSAALAASTILSRCSACSLSAWARLASSNVACTLENNGLCFRLYRPKSRHVVPCCVVSLPWCGVVWCGVLR